MTLIRWSPEVVYVPIAEAHAVATQEAARAAQALAPGRIQVHAIPSSTYTAVLGATGKGALFQEVGTKPHEEVPSRKLALAGGKFGPFARVEHPGNPALHYTRRGAETYPEAFEIAARERFVL